MISHIYGLEELILSECPYHPKQPTDLINPYQTTHVIFHRTRTNNPKIYTEPQKTLSSQSNLGKKEQRERYHAL